MSKVYTLIAYDLGTEAWINRCGDFCQGREASMDVIFFNDKDELGKELGKLLFNNNNLEAKILINGIDENCDHLGLDDELIENNEAEVSDIWSIAYTTKDELLEKKKLKDTQLLEEKNKKKALEELRIKKEIEKSEKETLRLLKQKYE